MDVSLTFQKHIKRWTRITQKCSKQGDDCIMSYLSQGMMEYTHKRPKKKKLQNTPQQRDKWCKIFLSPLTAKVMQKSTVQKDGIALEKYKNIAQNEPQNTSKWLPEVGEMLWKGLSSDAPFKLTPTTSVKKMMWSNWMVLQQKRSIKK